MDLRLGVFDRGIGDPGLCQGILQPLDNLLSLRDESILHLHLQHQVAAAPEIEPESDVVFQLAINSSFDFGMPMIP